jgi:hypothetical protein
MQLARQNLLANCGFLAEDLDQGIDGLGELERQDGALILRIAGVMLKAAPLQQCSNGQKSLLRAVEYRCDLIDQVSGFGLHHDAVEELENERETLEE